jgi:hypothetical protein
MTTALALWLTKGWSRLATALALWLTKGWSRLTAALALWLTKGRRLDCVRASLTRLPEDWSLWLWWGLLLLLLLLLIRLFWKVFRLHSLQQDVFLSLIFLHKGRDFC